MSDSRSQNSDNESSYVRAHAEPYNAPPSRRRSTSSSRTRKRSKTLGGAQDTTQTPSTTAGGQRRPSLASITPGPRPGFQNAPPLPSPLNRVVTEETQHLETGDKLAPSSSGGSINASASGGRNDSLLPFIPPKTPHLEGADRGVEVKDAQRSRHGASEVHVGKKQEAERSILPEDTRKPLEVVTPAPGSSKLVHENIGSSYRTRRPPPITSTWLKEPETRETTSYQKPRLSPSRSQTFPLPTGSNTIIESSNSIAQRRPSEPSTTSQSSWPLAAAGQVPLEKPVTHSPLPSTMLFSGRSYHSRTDSTSSYGSVNSVEQSASSRSSQPMQDVEPEEVSDDASKHGQPTVQEPATLIPPRPPLVDYDAESPTDPAFQNGRLTPVEPPALRRTQTTPEPPSQTLTNTASKPERDPKRQPLLRSKTTGGDKGQCRGCSKMIAANQKSVSSADGRLTGRYHKECFSCTTCHSAFATADFYVLKDQPYCAQHYHALNGSLCGSCGRGIEGQYLEATRSETKGVEKFHAKCFTCVMCRVVLKHDYFAHHGRFFCERDIHRVASPPNRSPNSRRPGGGSGPGGSSYLSAGNGIPRGKFPERRSTKLMIMS